MDLIETRWLRDLLGLSHVILNDLWVVSFGVSSGPSFSPEANGSKKKLSAHEPVTACIDGSFRVGMLVVG